jgi:hypothetical protein
MTKKEGYSKRMERKLADWKSRFEAKREQASRAQTISPQDKERLEACKVSGDAAFAKLGELRSTAARWLELRDEMEKLYNDIDATLGQPEDAATEPALRRASSV